MLNSDLDIDTNPDSVTKSLASTDRHIITELSIDAVSQRRCHRSIAMPIFAEATARAAQLTDSPVAILMTVADLGYQISAVWGLDKFTNLAATANLQALAGLEYCYAKTIASGDRFSVANFRFEPQLAQSALCCGHGVRAYLGVPVMTAAKDILGTLAILDFEPRQFSDRDVDLLAILSRLVASEFERKLLSQEQLGRWVGELKYPELAVSGFDDPQAASEHARVTNPDLEHSHYQLLAHLVRELRTPLTSVLGMTSVLQQEIYGELGDKQKDYLSIIHGSGQRLVTIVDEISTLSESDDRQPVPSVLQPVDLEMLCRLAIQSLEPLIQQKQQRIAIDFTGTTASDLRYPARWTFDRHKARQIIYYLCSNLIHHTAPNRQISIRAHSQSKLQLQFITSDDRVALKLADRDRLQPDRDLSDSQAAERSLWLSLGLAYSQSLALAHGGKIDIIAHGRGYQLSLPLIAAVQSRS